MIKLQTGKLSTAAAVLFKTGKDTPFAKRWVA
jgi:hypothetical protein